LHEALSARRLAIGLSPCASRARSADSACHSRLPVCSAPRRASPRCRRGHIMPHIAIIGSGPAGYTAEAAQKHGGMPPISTSSTMPVPYGLIRSGVAPTTSRSRACRAAMRPWR
jgi:hypothetical protein